MRKDGPPQAAVFVAVTAAIAAVLFWPRKASAATNYDDTFNYGSGDDSGDVSTAEIPAIMTNNPLAAMLFLIRHTEHTRADADSGTAYNTFYGGSHFSNMSDHPVLTGEKKGVPLSDSMCRAAGFGPGCVSTAAGAYQLIVPTWSRVRAAGPWGPKLPDFSPASQDEAARRLLLECGALTQLAHGDLAGALQRASKLWASLPGSTAGQHSVSVDQAVALFTEGTTIYG